MRCDAITVAVDAISTACDEASLSESPDRIEDIAADRIQGSVTSATQNAEELRREVRLLDMRLEDIWSSLD